MNEIEKYIQFAIDNWFKVKQIWDFSFAVKTRLQLNWEIISMWNCLYYELYELITSKQFIEAIARGIFKDKKLFVSYAREKPFIKWEDFSFIKEEDYEFIYKKPLTYNITTLQAIAIRDNKLEEFITNLWILW